MLGGVVQLGIVAEVLVYLAGLLSINFSLGK